MSRRKSQEKQDKKDEEDALSRLRQKGLDDVMAMKKVMDLPQSEREALPILLKFNPNSGHMDVLKTPACEAALINARVNAVDFTRALERRFHEMAEDALGAMDIEARVEMHMEEYLDQEIRAAAKRGWSSGKETITLAKIVDRKVRELAAGKIADGYRVEVSVKLIQKATQ